MDILTFAADAVFSDTAEDMSVILTPTKGGRTVLSEMTNMVNISRLQAPSTATKTKSVGGPTTLPSSPGTQGFGRGGGNGKSLSYPSPGQKGMSPSQTSAVGLGRSPLTPMSNLKLLTRIASMEESLTSKKELFQNLCKNSEDITPPVVVESDPKLKVPQLGKLRRHKSDSLNQNNGRRKLGKCITFRKHPSSSDYPSLSSPGNLVLEGVGQLTSLDETTQRSSEGSRKDKSLGLLSEKFLEHFPMEVSLLETPRRLVIDEVAAELGTERRRVYDIINVLESLNMAARVQKNMYQWTGRLHLEHTLARLKGLALKLDLNSQLHHLHHHHSNKDQSCQQFSCIKASINAENDKPDTRREKSLGVLCQKFVMLLLVSPEPRMLSLEHAVRLVVGETGEDGERLRTRGRRLYDIANVLTSLGLVRRIPLAKAFQYIGPQVEACTSDEDSLGVVHRHSLLPSRLGVGSGKGKENLSCPGNHEVTPSNVPPPVQKRGRPRKLSPDFSASTLPVAKRSKFNRTRSEDTFTSTTKETCKLTRHPSLHDICQVAEVEREKLLQKEQQKLQDLARKASFTSGPFFPAAIQVQAPAVESHSRPAKFLPTSLLRKHLDFTSHTRVPVALTFQGGQVQSHRQDPPSTKHSNPHTYTPYNHPHTINPNFPQVGMKPLQIGNKVLYTSGGHEAATTPVFMVRGAQHHNPAVIKVITKTGKPSVHQQEPSTVITVLPTGNSSGHNSGITKQVFIQTDMGLQPLSGASIHRVQESNSPIDVRNGILEGSQNKSGSYAVYTASGSQITFRKLSRVEADTCPSPAIQPPQHLEPVTTTPTPHLSHLQSPIVRPGTRLISGPAFHSSTLSSRSWQPSPDGSSTDSELEEIFGDSFKFSRPKNLMCGNSSQDGTSSDKLVCQAGALPLHHLHTSLFHTCLPQTPLHHSMHTHQSSPTVLMQICGSGQCLGTENSAQLSMNNSNTLHQSPILASIVNNVSCFCFTGHQGESMCSSHQVACNHTLIPHTSEEKLEPSYNSPFLLMPVDSTDNSVVKIECSDASLIEASFHDQTNSILGFSNGAASGLGDTINDDIYAHEPLCSVLHSSATVNEQITQIISPVITESKNLKWMKKPGNEIGEKSLVEQETTHSTSQMYIHSLGLAPATSPPQSLISHHSHPNSLPQYNSALPLSNSLLDLIPLPIAPSFNALPSLPGSIFQCTAPTLSSSSFHVASSQSAGLMLPPECLLEVSSLSDASSLLDEPCMCHPATCLLHDQLELGDGFSYPASSLPP